MYFAIAIFHLQFFLWSGVDGGYLICVAQCAGRVELLASDFSKKAWKEIETNTVKTRVQTQIKLMNLTKYDHIFLDEGTWGQYSCESHVPTAPRYSGSGWFH